MPDNDIRWCELPVLGLRFTLSTPAEGLLDISGGILHGALGYALKSVDCDAYTALFERAQYGSRQPFPWRMVVFPIRPCRLVVEFILFGSATRFAMPIATADFASSFATAVKRLAEKALG